MKIFSDLSDPIIKVDSKLVYSPSDDTYLLLDYFKKCITAKYFDGIKLTKIKKILDMGTGSGIIAIFFQRFSELHKNFNPEIYASDILPEAISCAKKNEKLNNINQKINFIQSDLFSSFPNELKNKFDIIIFNPPYLPSINNSYFQEDYKNIDLSWNGGKMGYEIILKFIIHFKNYINLKPPSYGYFISSSHTDLLKLRNSIEGYNLYLEELSKKHIFFEDIILNRVKIAKV